MAHASGGVEQRGQPKRDGVAVHIGGLYLGGMHQGANADEVGVFQRLEAVPGEHAVLAAKVHDIGDGADAGQGGYVEQILLEFGRQLAAFFAAVGDGPSQFEGHHRARRMRVGIVRIQPRMHNGLHFRQTVARFVVVGDDDLHAEFIGQLDLVEAGDAAIDGDHQLGAALGQLADGVGVEAVALIDAVGDVIIDLCAEDFQQVPQDGHAGDAVHVVIAVDGDFFPVRDRALDVFGGLRDAVHRFRLDQVGQLGG